MAQEQKRAWKVDKRSLLPHEGVQAHVHERIKKDLGSGLIRLQLTRLILVTAAKQHFIGNDVKLPIKDRLSAHKDVVGRGGRVLLQAVGRRR